MSWHAIRAVAEEVDLWLGLAVNVWIVIAGSIVILRRRAEGQTFSDAVWTAFGIAAWFALPIAFFALIWAGWNVVASLWPS